MAKKKQTISTLKKQSWQEFSKWIRLRDCVKTTGDTESGVCITCGKLIPFKQSQAGHFIAGRTNAVLFDEDIVHLQCYSCNVCNHGEQLEYYYAMQRLGYTEEEITKMRQRRYTTLKLTAEDYTVITERYKEKQALLKACLSRYGAYSPKVISLVSLPHSYE